MKYKEFEKYLKRDIRCPHCGKEDDTLIPGHRRSRGIGGSKLLDASSNILVMCSEINSLLESDPKWMKLGKEYGWKLNTGDDPEFVPVYDVTYQTWSILDNNFGRFVLINHDMGIE
jgi:hypothetical protein